MSTSIKPLSKAELFRHKFPTFQQVCWHRNENASERSYLSSLVYLSTPIDAEVPPEISAEEAAEMICGVFPQYPSGIAQVVQGLCALLYSGVAVEATTIRLHRILSREKARQIGLLTSLPTVEEVVKNHPGQTIVEAFAHAIGGGGLLGALVSKYGEWVAQDPILAELVFQAEQASSDHDEGSAKSFLIELVHQINQVAEG